jgi:uncharacterized protein (TIGR02145 family)
MKKITFLMILAGVLVLFVLVVFSAPSYRLTPGTEQCIDEQGLQKKVKNNCAADIFVPTNTPAEWNAFVNGAPSCVQISNCTWTCGCNLTVTHTAGSVAPETKTVTYKTVQTSLSGASKCWIAQNLGATNQASSATDATQASAGWYWQFNRKQGYQTGPTSGYINENYNWQAANDPCTLLLGTGWRLPTNTEWTNVVANMGCTSSYDAYASVLKLHNAGYLNIDPYGTLVNRGIEGRYWSGTQFDSGHGHFMYIVGAPGHGNICYGPSYTPKSVGESVRCLKD